MDQAVDKSWVLKKDVGSWLRNPEQAFLRNEETSAERRSAARTKISLPACCRLSSADSPWHQTRLLDISSAGAKLRMQTPVRPGDELHLFFLPPKSAEGVCAKARVVRRVTSQTAAGTDVGVVFDGFKEIFPAEEPFYHMPDRLCELVLKYTPLHMECRPTQSPAEAHAAYRLVYREYLASGYCTENSARMHFGFHSLLPDSRSFLIQKTGKILGTLSLFPDSPAGLPMERSFPDSLRALRQNSRRIAEVGLFALSGSIFGGKNLALTHFHKMTSCFWLFKVMLDYCRTEGGVTNLLVAVHPKHELLYRNLAFRPVAVRDSYPAALGQPALAMHLDLQRLERSLDSQSRFYDFFFSRKFPALWFRQGLRWTAESLSRLLAENISFFDALPLLQKNYLMTCYPNLKLPGRKNTGPCAAS